MEEIDGELGKFDNIEGWSEEKLTSANSVAHTSLVGSWVAGSAQFLKNLFVQNRPSKTPISKSKPTRVIRKQSFARKPIEVKKLTLAKRLRQELDEDMEEKDSRMKRRASNNNDSTVEASV